MWAWTLSGDREDDEVLLRAGDQVPGVGLPVGEPRGGRGDNLSKFSIINYYIFNEDQTILVTCDYGISTNRFLLDQYVRIPQLILLKFSIIINFQIITNVNITT